MTEKKRREFIKAGAGLGIAGSAGCMGGGIPGPGNVNRTATEQATEQRTSEPTGTGAETGEGDETTAEESETETGTGKDGKVARIRRALDAAPDPEYAVPGASYDNGDVTVFGWGWPTVETGTDFGPEDPFARGFGEDDMGIWWMNGHHEGGGTDAFFATYQQSLDELKSSFRDTVENTGWGVRTTPRGHEMSIGFLDLDETYLQQYLPEEFDGGSVALGIRNRKVEGEDVYPDGVDDARGNLEEALTGEDVETLLEMEDPYGEAMRDLRDDFLVDGKTAVLDSIEAVGVRPYTGERDTAGPETVLEAVIMQYLEDGVTGRAALYQQEGDSFTPDPRTNTVEEINPRLEYISGG